MVGLWNRIPNARVAWFVVYAIVALVSGICFYYFTGGQDSKVTIPALGIRLSGGAAVGAALILLINSLLGSPLPSRVVIPLPREHWNVPFAFYETSENVNVSAVDGMPRHYVVEFIGGSSSGWARGMQPDLDSYQMQYYLIELSRSGKAKSIRLEEK